MDSDPLGIFSAAVLRRMDLRLAAGDRIFLYSDGLIEAVPGGGREHGVERLTQACISHRFQPLKEAVEAIARELRPDAGTVEDDLLLLATEAA
jgi:sigma-B regulation protein RsbU (phosphoserine phosphatase)